MADIHNESENDKPVPADQTGEQQGETKKVDTEAQEDAAEDRANSGGYQ